MTPPLATRFRMALPTMLALAFPEFDPGHPYRGTLRGAVLLVFGLVALVLAVVAVGDL